MKKILIFFVKVYQKIMSPHIPNCCRFYPSCSEYAVQVLQKHGSIKGCYLTLKRLAKCHPFHPGGIDNP